MVETLEPPEKQRKTTTPIHHKPSVYEDTNGVPRTGFPPRVLHLGLAQGELAGRVVVVGHPARADLLAKMLKPEETGGSVFRLASDRGFLTYTGLYDGKRVSIVSIGMGLAMMDFFVREARACVRGPMAVVRLGTCGGLRADVPVGSVAVATEGCVLVQRNYEAFANGAEPDEGAADGHTPYLISPPCAADAELSTAVVKELKTSLGEGLTVGGLNATADSFYSSQGRIDPCFADANKTLFSRLSERHPEAVTMEMETFQLLHLAHSCRPAGSLRAASAVAVVANRPTGDVVVAEDLERAERVGGEAILRALAGLSLGAED